LLVKLLQHLNKLTATVTTRHCHCLCLCSGVVTCNSFPPINQAKTAVTPTPIERCMGNSKKKDLAFA
jgi:hypothetical protein